jgi:DNA-directed RNA polymerase subunit A"
MSKESQEDYLVDVELPPQLMEDFEKFVEKEKLDSEKKMKLLEEIKKEYLLRRYEPGEAIGIISAQSISEPSTQMSLPYEEKILIKENDIIYPIEIGKFVDNLLNKFFPRIEGNAEILDLPENLNIYVYSIDNDEKLKVKRIKSVIRHKSPKKLLEIKTSSGRKIVATDYHSFVIRKNNKIIPVSGKELKVGDRLPIMKFLPENCITEIQLGSVISSDKINVIGDKIYPINYKFNKNSKFLLNKLPLDFSFGWLVGAYLSEGNCTKYFVSISNTEEDGLTINEYDNFRGFSRGRDININSLLLFELLKTICGTNSRNKKIPYFAFSAEKDFVKGLLQAYFDGNGNVTLDRKGIRVSSESKELIDGIAILLNRFGIFSSKSDDGHWLWIPYNYAECFLNSIGTSIPERQKLLKKLIERYKKKSVAKEYTDMIPGIGDILFSIAKKLKFPTRYVNNFTKRQLIGRETLKKYIRKFEEIAKKVNIDISNELIELKNAVNSDIVWDKIEKISYVDSNSKYVYDISVDGLETFVTFDGIITHNTMRAYHFAGSAGVKVTQGLPRLMEIFDAKKEPETPFTTIYLKKEFNNRDDAAKLAESLVERKVKDVIRSISINLAENYLEIELIDKRKSERVIKKLKEYLKGFDVKEMADTIVIKPKKESKEVDIRKMREKVLDINVEGIKGISSAIVRKEGDEWIISTVGSNFEEILKLNEVDTTRTVTNNIFEIWKVLGIEAARNAIINEAMNTLQEQGLDVDIRHLNLVADMMTFSGTIEPIGRYGVAGAKTSILARAAFEETIKHLVRASVRNEKDEFKGIFENVMIGQVIPSGTGMFELLARKKEKSEK